MNAARRQEIGPRGAKPETAEAELKGLLAADPSLRTEVLERNSLLLEKWRAAEWEIQRARKTRSKMGSPEAEAMQKRFYSRDSHNMPTNNQVSVDCSHCNGTGWR